MSAVCAVLPSSGLTHFWDTAGQSSVVMPMTASDTQNGIADVQFLIVYSATNPSLSPSVAQISALMLIVKDFERSFASRKRNR